MNVLSYKVAPPSFLRWPGRDVYVQASPLSQAAVERARLAAEALFAAHGCEPQGYHFDAEVAIQTLALAISVPPGDLRCAVTPEELGHLYLEWLGVQAVSQPDMGSLREEIRKAVLTDPSVMMDGVRSCHVSGPAEFYGISMNDLTDGQLAYFLLVRAAHEEMSSSGKMVSKQWLTSNGN